MKYRDKIAPYWHNVGIYLLEKPNVINIIRRDYPSDLGSCCMQMLEYWLKVDDEASWNKLIDALQRIHLNGIAERIRQDILLGKVYKL